MGRTPCYTYTRLLHGNHHSPLSPLLLYHGSKIHLVPLSPAQVHCSLSPLISLVRSASSMLGQGRGGSGTLKKRKRVRHWEKQLLQVMKKNLVRFKNGITPPHFVALPQAKACNIKKYKTCLCWPSSLRLGKRTSVPGFTRISLVLGLEEVRQEYAGILGQHYLH